MKTSKMFTELVLLVISLSIIPLHTSADLSGSIGILTILLQISLFIFLLFRSGERSDAEKRLRRLSRGADMLALGGMAAVCETAVYLVWFSNTTAGTAAKIGAAVIPLTALFLYLAVAVIRVSVAARQLKILDYVLLLLLWYIPIIDLFILRKFYKTARREYIFELSRSELEQSRAVSQICKTKYPIIMVHGIFFRDWQLVNYWGRIPATLIRNGAAIYYGRQQSAKSVCDSGAELRDTIMQVLAETGAEKVNIIAHSKGGLDSRYAISCLGMDKYVATLTTINTPHYGCDMVDYLLARVPEGMKNFIASRYNKIFSKLGDPSPDFMAGVNDLSAVRAKSYDSEMPDMPGVSYRSCMSLMSKATSAGFPLNIGYLLIKKLNGRNDGLVWENSARRGESFKMVETAKKRGVSHGDIIDLMRENIEGFDVREFYADIAAELKQQGY